MPIAAGDDGEVELDMELIDDATLWSIYDYFK